MPLDYGPNYNDNTPNENTVRISNLLEAMEDDERLDISLGEIEKADIEIFVNFGYAGTLYYEMDEWTTKIFKGLNCSTLRDALPYMLAHCRYSVSEDSIKMYEDLEKKYRVVMDEVNLDPSLSGCAGKMSAILFVNFIYLYSVLHNSKNPLTQSDAVMFKDGFLDLEKMRVIKSANLKYTIRDKGNSN